MANTVSGPYTATNWQDGITQGGHLNMNNLETQSKVALASLNPDLVSAGFVLSGAQASRHNAYAATVLADAPLNYFRLNETLGTGVLDLGVLAQNGVTHGAPTQGVAGLLTGDPDFCYTFASASSQYISLTTTGLPTGAAAFTIEAWVKFAANPAAVATVVWLGKATANTVAWLYIDTAGKANFGTDGGPLLTTASALTTGVAHQLVATYDGTSMRLYVDGALSQGPTAETFAIAYAAGAANIGATATPNQYFNGQIDEVAIYTGALSASRVTTHYTNGTTATTQVDIASGTAYLLQSDGTLARCVIGATSETTVSTNTTYYLYLQPDGSWYWSTTNAPAANSLAIARVSTDGAGNVHAVFDERPTTIPFFSAATTLPVPRIITQTIGYFVNQTALTTFTSNTTLPAGLYRVSGAFHQANVSGAENITFSVVYSDLTGVTRTIYFSNGAGVVYNGATSIANGDYAATPLVFYIQANSIINVNYQDPAGSPLDKVSAVIERLA